MPIPHEKFWVSDRPGCQKVAEDLSLTAGGSKVAAGSGVLVWLTREVFLYSTMKEDVKNRKQTAFRCKLCRHMKSFEENFWGKSDKNGGMQLKNENNENQALLQNFYFLFCEPLHFLYTVMLFACKDNFRPLKWIIPKALHYVCYAHFLSCCSYRVAVAQVLSKSHSKKKISFNRKFKTKGETFEKKLVLSAECKCEKCFQYSQVVHNLFIRQRSSRADPCAGAARKELQFAA